MLFINWQLKQLNLFIFIFFIPLINSQVIFLNTTESPKLWIDPPDLGEFRIGDKRTIWLIVYTNETAWSGQVIINCEWPKINCPLNETECPIKYSVQLDKENEFAQWININLKGNFVGLNRIEVFAGKTEFFYRIRTSKTKIYSKLTNILIPIFGVVIGIGNFLTGLQLNICKDGLQPISLFIVFLCQFIFKPLTLLVVEENSDDRDQTLFGSESLTILYYPTYNVQQQQNNIYQFFPVNIQQREQPNNYCSCLAWFSLFMSNQESNFLPKFRNFFG
uniref:Transmembrane protein n=1 Tax=Meloidogyne hapla TaxID=6305 RepID=A0A1I8B829_MELHA